MEDLWPLPTVEAADAIRTLCQRLLMETDAMTEVIAGAALMAQYEPALLPDASLVEEDRHLNRSDLVQWLTSNIQRPGRRVEPYIGPRIAEYIRDLVSRGIAPDFAGGWREALGVGWRRWLEECVAHCTDPDLLVEVLDVSAKSLVQYALDSVSALREASLASAMSDANADAIALIQLIASGAPMTEDLAEGRLRYRLARSHMGLVVWTDDPQRANALDDVVAAVRSASTGKRPDSPRKCHVALDLAIRARDTRPPPRREDRGEGRGCSSGRRTAGKGTRRVQVQPPRRPRGPGADRSARIRPALHGVRGRRAHRQHHKGPGQRKAVRHQDSRPIGRS